MRKRLISVPIGKAKNDQTPNIWNSCLSLLWIFSSETLAIGCSWDMFRTSCLFPPLLLRAEKKGGGPGHLGPYTSYEMTIEFLLQMLGKWFLWSLGRNCNYQVLKSPGNVELGAAFHLGQEDTATKGETDKWKGVKHHFPCRMLGWAGEDAAGGGGGDGEIHPAWPKYSQWTLWAQCNYHLPFENQESE